MSATLRRTAQAGFTLVELMVAMTLGMVLMVVISNVFVASKESYRTTEDMSRLQENARFAVTHLGRVLRMASYVDDPTAVSVTRASIFGAAPAVTGTEGGGTVSDSVTVRYQGSADGTVFDCQGNQIAGGAFVVARFHLAAAGDGSGTTSLYCDNTGTVGPVAADLELVQGVENLQVLYGEDTDGDGTANRYLVQSSVTTLDNVVSLRIGLLMSTANQVASATDTRTYNVIGTSIGPINDKRVRRMYTTTIALRNRAP
jgi:type IV pilus assembly protein PilW